MPKSRRKGYPLSHARGARHAPLRLEHVRGFVTSEIRTGRRLDGPGTRWRRRSCARRWLRSIPRPIPEEGPLLLAHGAVRSAPAAWAAVQPRRADRLRGPVHGHSPVGRFPYGKPPSRGGERLSSFFLRDACLAGRWPDAPPGPGAGKIRREKRRSRGCRASLRTVRAGCGAIAPAGGAVDSGPFREGYAPMFKNCLTSWRPMANAIR